MSNCPARLATLMSVERRGLSFSLKEENTIKGEKEREREEASHDLSVSRTLQHVSLERRDNRNPDSFETFEWERNWTLVSERCRMKILRG